MKPIVVIPIYKELNNWQQNERLSLQQCCQVLRQHPLCIIGPHKLDWEQIKNFIRQKHQKDFIIKTFDDHYFADIPGYNIILKSLFFYRSFTGYSHLLIYQLDAFVFRDELMKWCHIGYDYIGAPWLEGYINNSATSFVGVGNGGFSLHNITAAIKTIKRIRTILRILEPAESSLIFKKLPILKWGLRYFLLKLFFGINDQRYVRKLSRKDSIFEDKFWGRYVPTTFSDFKIASIEDATKFSFEVNPRHLYKLNKERLPFGCHAWEKYDPAFWSQFITNCGHVPSE